MNYLSGNKRLGALAPIVAMVLGLAVTVPANAQRSSPSRPSAPSRPSGGSGYGGGSSGYSKAPSAPSAPRSASPSGGGSGGFFGGGQKTSTPSTPAPAAPTQRSGLGSIFGQRSQTPATPSGATGGGSQGFGGSNAARPTGQVGQNGGASQGFGGANRNQQQPAQNQSQQRNAAVGGGSQGFGSQQNRSSNTIGRGYQGPTNVQVQATSRSNMSLRYTAVTRSYPTYTSSRYNYVTTNPYGYGYNIHPYNYYNSSNYWLGGPGYGYGSYGWYSGYYSGLYWGSPGYMACYGCAYGAYMGPGYWNRWGYYGFHPAYSLAYSVVALSSDLLAYGLVNWMYGQTYQQVQSGYQYSTQDQQVFQASLPVVPQKPFSYSQVYLPTTAMTNLVKELSGANGTAVQNFITGLTSLTSQLEQRIAQSNPGQANFRFQANEIDIRDAKNVAGANELVVLNGQVTRNDPNTRQPIISQVFEGAIDLSSGQVLLFAPVLQPGQTVAQVDPSSPDLQVLNQINAAVNAESAKYQNQPQQAQGGGQGQGQGGGYQSQYAGQTIKISAGQICPPGATCIVKSAWYKW